MNFEIQDDQVATIPILTSDAQGAIVAAPVGDAFSASSDHPNSLATQIGADASGNPVLVLTPLVQASPGINVTVSDSKGLAAATLVVDVVPDHNPTNVVLGAGNAVFGSQPAPTDPGP